MIDTIQQTFNEFSERNPHMVQAALRAVEKGKIPKLAGTLSVDKVAETLKKPAVSLENNFPVAGDLEAIVRLIGRPPLLVQGDAVVQEPLEDFPADIGARIRATEKWLPSVGRVEFINHDMRWGGTGWVVRRISDAEAIVVTNRHVAKIVARRAENGAGLFMRSPAGILMGMTVDFNEEAGARPQDSRDVRVTKIKYLADDIAADVALLMVTADGGALRMPAAINLLERDARDKELIALVGYPAYDSRNDAAAMSRYFRDMYDVKRFAPGYIIKPAVNAVLSHDATSLGGNSGSVLLSLEEDGAIGLHFAGLYGRYNSAVSAPTLEKLLNGRIVVPGSSAGDETNANEAVSAASSFSDRTGYNPGFLEKGTVAWPRLPEDLQAELATPSDTQPANPHELRYTHFGVLLSAVKKLPVLTAVNIDGKSSVRIKRGKDKWSFDGRIPKDQQMGDPAYIDASIDRGHMVRREDPNWSSESNEAESQQANNDTFHFTNCAPQHSSLNQGKALWQGLENYILDSSRTHGFRACVFSAPVYRDDDPKLDAGVKVPLEFWKVVVTLNETGQSLHATAYLLSQGQLIRDLLEKRNRTEAIEGFVLGAYRTFQISISDLAEATGFDFNGLEAYDPLRKAGTQEGVEPGQPILVPVYTPEELVL
ncbi:DNA/RNA non-specific endonuclease [Rhizobium sophoriradicis]|uniref:Nuclease n=1 Tax=Rhizobium sophoriradicis TaxID=1535245 RepID=A0A2A5KL01_9HYPH|nr:DNA/RNA non-specific endonuclease [Rhizobium sophoriradicis]PCK77675.1 nuclease [Rhizobium sophoriradicis]